jgi:hypothetical protein
MRAICHKCGATKAAPLQGCTSCGSLPINDDELALSFMLTDQFLSTQKLAEASLLIKSGQRIELPPHIRTAFRSAMRNALAQQPTSQKEQGGCLRAGVVLASIAMILFLLFHPWPHYQWASFWDRVPSYESFVTRFPDSYYKHSAQERIRVLREPEVWSEATEANQIGLLRDYIRVYSDGKHLDQAKAQVTALADAQWRRIAAGRSVPEINRFLIEYPETTMRADAERRIQELYNDWNWVREQDSIEHYQRFAARNPLHPERKWIEKRIIDLEVAQIASGEHGELPRAQPLSSGGATVELEVENRTSYELTVRYSGPESKKLVIPPGATRTVSLPPGDYKVAASVTAANVRNYYGSDAMRGGRYSSSFYIQSSYGGVSIPTYRPRQR